MTDRGQFLKAVRLLQDLWEWNAITGYWDAPCWERTRKFLDEIAKQRKTRKRLAPMAPRLRVQPSRLKD